MQLFSSRGSDVLGAAESGARLTAAREGEVRAVAGEARRGTPRSNRGVSLSVSCCWRCGEVEQARREREGKKKLDSGTSCRALHLSEVR